MSLGTALKAVGLVVVGLVLLWTFVAMGPIAWVVIGTMLAVGVIQVHRERRRGADEGDETPAYCPNCGTEIEVAYDAAGDAGGEWAINFCPECGAPVAPDSESEAAARPQNCPDCGALNDPLATECEYCHADL